MNTNSIISLFSELLRKYFRCPDQQQFYMKSLKCRKVFDALNFIYMEKRFAYFQNKKYYNG